MAPMAPPEVKQTEDDDEYGDDDGLSWYASAAADPTDEGAEASSTPALSAGLENQEEALTDPYMLAESDPYMMVGDDVDEAPAEVAPAKRPVPEAPAPVAAAPAQQATEPAASAATTASQRPRKVAKTQPARAPPRGSKPKDEAITCKKCGNIYLATLDACPKCGAAKEVALPDFLSLSEPPKQAEPALALPEKLPLKQLAQALNVQPLAQESSSDAAFTPSWLQENQTPSWLQENQTPSWLQENQTPSWLREGNEDLGEGDGVLHDPDPVAHDPMAEVPEPELVEEDFMGEDEALSWDAKCVVVRQGQIHVEIQRRKPPMDDAGLLKFCDWLNEQMPLVVSNFPYVKKSGAYVDLSDNEIGTEGLDKLFRVLRDHRVPCVVLKAYRNALDDSFVDTLIEYLYTQPETFPMHGIHISHNNISDKGAFRLIRAAAECGHYPRLTSRLPLWLRLEVNQITNPQKVIADSKEENFNVCLMQDGLCSRPDCNHYSGVHVQLPYFLNQPAKGPANLEQFGNSLPRQLQAFPKTSTQGIMAPKAKAAPPALQRAPQPSSAPEPEVTPQYGGASGSTNPAFVKAAGARPSPDLGGKGDWNGGKPQWQGKGKENGGAWGNGNKGKGGGWKGGGGGRGGGWKDGGKDGGWNGGKGGGKWKDGGGGGGGGGGRGRMWLGKSLVAKVKKDTKIPEGVPDIGFQWRYVGDGQPPQLVSVAPGSIAGQIAQVGESLLRVNGLDMSMMSEQQITDLLKQRPLDLRFGDA